jgi:hypothetical protein
MSRGAGSSFAARSGLGVAALSSMLLVLELGASSSPPTAARYALAP